MTTRSKLVVAGLIAVSVGFVFYSQQKRQVSVPAEQVKPSEPAAEAPAVEQKASAPDPRKPRRMKATDLASDDIAAFNKAFEKRYKPAISNWCRAYDGHLPFKPEDITPDKLKEKIGLGNPADYVFVTDQVTVAIRDRKEGAFVSYINDAKQTPKMMDTGDGSVPITKLPVSREDLIGMLADDSGRKFNNYNVRMQASGISSGLNGGVNFQVGGDANNFISWEYTITFGKDGTLIYYMIGPTNFPVKMAN